MAAIIQSLLDRVDALETALDAAQRHRQSEDEWQDSEIIRELRGEIEELKHDQQDQRRELEDRIDECEARDISEEVVAQHVDHLVCEDGVHDLIASYIIDDDSGVLRRKVLSIVADALQGR